MLAPDKTGKAIATRQRILSAALALFSERGFIDTTMRDIAVRAGVAIGAAYYYFKTKEDFLAARIAELSTPLPQLAQRTRGTHLTSRLNAFNKLCLQHFAPHRVLLRPIGQFLFSDDHPLSNENQSRIIINTSIEQAISTLLKPVKNEITPKLRAAANHILTSFFQGEFLFWLNDSSEEQSKTQEAFEIATSLLADIFTQTHREHARPTPSSPLERKITMALLTLFQQHVQPAATPRLRMISTQSTEQDWYFDTEPSDAGSA